MVEDDKRLAATLRRGLEAEGFAIDNALAGEQGLWLASENPYDAILLDIMLPEVNGFRVCARLRELGNWTPILMLTAKHGATWTRPKRSTPAPTTTSPNRSRRSCSSRISGRYFGAVQQHDRRS